MYALLLLLLSVMTLRAVHPDDYSLQSLGTVSVDGEEIFISLGDDHGLWTMTEGVYVDQRHPEGVTMVTVVFRQSAGITNPTAASSTYFAKEIKLRSRRWRSMTRIPELPTSLDRFVMVPRLVIGMDAQMITKLVSATRWLRPPASRLTRTGRPL